MMDRQTKLTILSTMDDHHLDQALEGLGIDCCSGQGDDFYGAEDPTNTLDKWSEMEVSIPDAGRGPIVDKSALFTQQMQQPQTNTYGLSMPGEDEEMMMASGMV